MLPLLCSAVFLLMVGIGLTEPTPSCADIKGTFPSAWRAAQLGRMAEGELGRCVEVLGGDDSLRPEQRRTLWSKLRRVGSHFSTERCLENLSS